MAQLERHGLLVRKPDKHDGRANTLHLTRSGKALAASLDCILLDLRKEMFASVSEAEGKSMVRILGLIEGWE